MAGLRRPRYPYRRRTTLRRRPALRSFAESSSRQGGHHDSHIHYHRGCRYTMTAPASTTVTPVRVADLLAEGELMSVYVHILDHPDARVLVDTGITELHPAVADL